MNFFPLAALLLIPLQDKLMVQLGENIYAEPGLSDADHQVLRAAHAAARADIERFFGDDVHAAPLVLFCRSPGCKEAFGADPGTNAAADLGFARDGVQTKDGFLATRVVVVTGPVPRTAKILTHEMVHAEMKAWRPYDSLPTWFNEGMAGWVAGTPDCSSLPQTSTMDVRALDTKQKWQAHLAATHATLRTYCESREEVRVWASHHANVAAALKEILSGRAEP